MQDNRSIVKSDIVLRKLMIDVFKSSSRIQSSLGSEVDSCQHRTLTEALLYETQHSGLNIPEACHRFKPKCKRSAY